LEAKIVQEQCMLMLKVITVVNNHLIKGLGTRITNANTIVR